MRKRKRMHALHGDSDRLVACLLNFLARTLLVVPKNFEAAKSATAVQRSYHDWRFEKLWRDGHKVHRFRNGACPCLGRRCALSVVVMVTHELTLCPTCTQSSQSSPLPGNPEAVMIASKSNTLISVVCTTTVNKGMKCLISCAAAKKLIFVYGNELQRSGCFSVSRNTFAVVTFPLPTARISHVFHTPVG